MKNMMKQQESSPFTTAGKSFEKNYILRGYYICVQHACTICKNLWHFSYIYKLVLYRAYKRRYEVGGGGGHHVNIE